MPLSQEEQMVLRYLKQMRAAGASAREICRKAGTKSMWEENDRWAFPVLQRLRDGKLVDTNKAGAYICIEQWGN